MKEKIKLVDGNIWELDLEAILCHANTELEPEEETTKKIMEKGGDDIQRECNKSTNLQKGKAIITCGGKLPIQYVIHVILNEAGGMADEDILMIGMKEALNLAKEKQIKHLGIPMIGQSTEVPVKRAAELILTEVKKHIEGETSIEIVTFVANDFYSYDAFEEGIRQL